MNTARQRLLDATAEFLDLVSIYNDTREEYGQLLRTYHALVARADAQTQARTLIRSNRKLARLCRLMGQMKQTVLELGEILREESERNVR